MGIRGGNGAALRNELGENTVLIGKADWVKYELKGCYPLIHQYLILKSDILIVEVEKIKKIKKTDV